MTDIFAQATPEQALAVLVFTVGFVPGLLRGWFALVSGRNA